MVNLEPSTCYAVQVQANCGDLDGTSGWVTEVFYTPDNCGAPTDLETSDVTYNSAILHWTGYQDNYDVQYRLAAYR
jgi:hypothetical protein